MVGKSEVLITFDANTKNLDKKVDGIKSGVGSKIGNVAKGIGTAFLKGTAVAGAAMVGMVAKSVKEFAKLEQSIGGVETLFKDSASTVIANAKKAYTTAGIDANKYMEQVTSFSASLLQSLGGDTQKAAEYADRAVRDMSDNANKFGTDMEMIQNAYQGFAKQNYTMLDNLKLGYGGTKTEMERLIADASKMADEQKKLNITVKEGDTSFGNIVNAISVMQEHLQVAGTTAKEAASTIQGSFNSMKASFTNFLSGAGSIDEVISTVTIFGDNVMNAIIKLAPKLIEGIVKLINKLIPKIPKLIKTLLPTVIQGVVQLALGIVQALPQLITVLASMLPSLIQSLIQGIITVVDALAQQMPVLIPTLVNAILDGLLSLLDNIDVIINAGIDLIMGLIQGIIASIPLIIAKMPLIIQGIINGLIGALPQLILMAPQIIIAIITGLLQSIPMLVQMAPQIINGLIKGLTAGLENFLKTGEQMIKRMYSGIKKGVKNILGKIPGIPKDIKEKIKSGFSNIEEIGRNVMKGLWRGISGLKNWVISKVKGLGKSIVKGLKGVLGIHSPSTEFALIGKFSVLGYTEALDKMSKDVDRQVASTFGISPQLTGSMQNSFSPNVNVYNNVNVEQDPLGQVVSNIKTFSGGAKNDYNFGLGV